MSSSKTCPFCDKSQAFRFIVESHTMRVVYPRNPVIPYHLLITPKRHIKLLDDLRPNEETELFELLKKITNKSKANLGSKYLGFNLLSNNGSETINQRIPHAHVHVFIRTKDDKDDPILARHTSTSIEFSKTQLENLASIKSWFN